MLYHLLFAVTFWFKVHCSTITITSSDLHDTNIYLPKRNFLKYKKLMLCSKTISTNFPPMAQEIACLRSFVTVKTSSPTAYKITSPFSLHVRFNQTP